MKKKLYTWNQFDRDCEYLYQEYFKPRKGLIKNIYGIPRGGLLVAIRLSHITGIPLVLKKMEISEKTLIVDDISDTGETLNKLLQGKRFFDIIVLWQKNAPRYPTEFLHEKKNQWVLFPWETNQSSKYDKTVAP